MNQGGVALLLQTLHVTMEVETVEILSLIPRKPTPPLSLERCRNPLNPKVQPLHVRWQRDDLICASPATRQPSGVSMPSDDLYIISHSSQVQVELDRLGIPWGAQYELARGESRGLWAWEDVKEVELKLLVGLNTEAAPRVACLMPNSWRLGPVDDIVWCVLFTYSHLPVNDTRGRAEYDREQDAIAEDHESRRGLGLYGDWAPWYDGSGEDWYGGRITQSARLVEEYGQFKVYLDTPTYGKNPPRFARFLGSRRMLRLSIPPRVDKDRLRNLLARKFVLCGRVFIALRPKEGKGGQAWKVYLIEVNENVDRRPKDSEGDHRRLTLREFVRWHNPIELNDKQARCLNFMTCIQLKWPPFSPSPSG